MKRFFKYGANAVITILLVLGILIFAILISKEHYKRFDLTENKRFTLDDKSVSVVKNLKKDVDITVFYKGRNFKESSVNLLDQFKYYSKMLNVKYLETNRNPLAARDYGLVDPNSMVIKSGKQKEILTNIDEESFTNAVLKVTQEKQVTVGFVRGHGERGLEQKSEKDYFFAVEALKKENYKIKTVTILEDEKALDNIDILIIAGPKNPFLESEIVKLKEFVDDGKSLLLLLQPGPEYEQLGKLLEQYGIISKDYIVVDELGERSFRNPFIVAVILPMLYGQHPITTDFKLMTVYPLCRPIILSRRVAPGIRFQPIVKTAGAPTSYAKKFKEKFSKDDIDYIKGTDMPGPINIAVAGTVPTKIEKGEKGEKKDTHKENARITVFGNVNFAANQFFLSQGNKNMFMNTISWLTRQDNLIVIRKNDAKFSPLNLNKKQKRIILTTCLVMLPGLILLAGIMMLWRRK
ncbi:MAG: GldG family protein [Candidatus Eremiobacteraeota bacterium]|nr:GldG family protein [Candidatus Eremiobacteraeota bacterium]